MSEPTKDKPRPSDEDGGYPDLLAHMRGYFTRALMEVPDGVLLRTNVDQLSQTFIGGLPTEYKQHYNCNTCKRFADRDGNIIIVDAQGNARSAMWHVGADWKPPATFIVSVDAMMHVVEAADPTGLFLSDKAVFGTSQTGGKLRDDGTRTDVWTHFSLTLPRDRVYRFAAESDDDPVNDEPVTAVSAVRRRAEHEVQRRKEGRASLMLSLHEFTPDVVDKSLAYLRSGSLYRVEKGLAVAVWFAELRRRLDACSDERRRALMLWHTAGKAPYTNLVFRGKSIGRLFKAVKKGESTEAIREMWNEMLAPENYQHAVAAPSEGNKRQAERIIDGLAAQGSLARRYARIEEVPLEWTPRGGVPTVDKPAGVFASVETRPSAGEKKDLLSLPDRTMTWVKFASTVLPKAVSMEVQVPQDTRSFVALVTAVDPAAPPLLQWDKAAHRNPFSWYYEAGIDASLRQKVMDAGGQYDDVDIRCSLAWRCENDLDLHCASPQDQHLYYGHKVGVCGGALDVDMNAHAPFTVKPVENMRWKRDKAPDGAYSFWVENYNCHARPRVDPTPFHAELEVGGKFYHMDGIVSGMHSRTEIARFEYRRGTETRMPTHLRQGTAVAHSNAWNLVPGKWAKVIGITRSPNMWGETRMPQFGDHTIFVLENCRDTGTTARRGFIVETLNAALHEVRATMERFLAGEPVLETERASVCGVGMSNLRPEWGLVLRVSDGRSQTTYCIDRAD